MGHASQPYMRAASISRADPVFVDTTVAGSTVRAHAPPDPGGHGRVPGSGESTIAEELSARLGWPFKEAIPCIQVKHRQGASQRIPLTDADRLPSAWPLGSMVSAPRAAGYRPCSALNGSYRRIIIGDRLEVRLVSCAAST